MKLPIPQELLDTLDETKGQMSRIVAGLDSLGSKLDAILDELKEQRR